MLKYRNNLIFLPGLLSDEQVWQYQLNDLKKNYRISVIPLIKFSSPVKIVKYVLKFLPSDFILIGHSLGGWIALEIMKHVPQSVKGLVLLNTTARPETEDKKIWRINLINQINNIGFSNLMRHILPLYLTPSGLSNKELYNKILGMFLRIGERIFIQQQKAIIQRPGCIDELLKISCPTLIIHSKNDQIMNYEMQKEMHDRIRNSKIELINNCGHFSMLEKPVEVLQILKYWLNKLESV